MNSNVWRKTEQVRSANTNHRWLERKFRKHFLDNDDVNDNLNFNQSFRGAIKACTPKQSNIFEIITTKHQ